MKRVLSAKVTVEGMAQDTKELSRIHNKGLKMAEMPLAIDCFHTLVAPDR